MAISSFTKCCRRWSKLAITNNAAGVKCAIQTVIHTLNITSPFLCVCFNPDCNIRCDKFAERYAATICPIGYASLLFKPGEESVIGWTCVPAVPNVKVSCIWLFPRIGHCWHNNSWIKQNCWHTHPHQSPFSRFCLVCRSNFSLR